MTEACFTSGIAAGVADGGTQHRVYVECWMVLSLVLFGGAAGFVWFYPTVVVWGEVDFRRVCTNGRFWKSVCAKSGRLCQHHKPEAKPWEIGVLETTLSCIPTPTLVIVDIILDR